MSESGTIAVVILAAGGSSRMGKPKQLLPIAGAPLLQRTVNAARGLRLLSHQAAADVAVFVVLGAASDEIQAALDFEQCQILHNQKWQEGMSTSVVLAVNHIQNSMPEALGVLLVMSDQPWVSTEHLAKIIRQFKATGSPVVISSFFAKGEGETIPGPPAFFARKIFPELLLLEGDAGARKVVMAHFEEMAAVDFPLGAIDIDTEADYASLLAAI
jgi:molybdenum cofactor cytidylyltransferase